MAHTDGDVSRRTGIISTNTMSAHGNEPGLKLVAGPGSDYQETQSHDEKEPVLQFPKVYQIEYA